ncbi:iron-containing redox enzyme family protein [Photorhabdus sp. P32]|uniref:iron-containing redox enzyme family protein n=1 Tax=Photorhabdus sp. P32 TaxID=3117549 RepID=UPI00311B3235
MTIHNTDRTTALPRGKFHFSPQKKTELTTLIRMTSSAKEFYTLFAKDIESEHQQLLALQLIETLLTTELNSWDNIILTPQTLGQYMAQAREALIQRISHLKQSKADIWDRLLRQRALLSLIAGCWLDYISQPATEPAQIVCMLSGHNFHLKGNGEIDKSQQQQRHRRLSELGINVPKVYTQGILATLQTTELTAWHAAFWLALSRLSASYLPEVIGFQYAYYWLGFDDALLNLPTPIKPHQLQQLLETYLTFCQHSSTGQDDIKRLMRAINAAVELELEHSDMLLELQNQLQQQTLDDCMAEIVKRHIPFAGKQHQRINLEQRSLTQWFNEKDSNMKVFLETFKHSPYLRQTANGNCSFLKAIRFGGPMFGIFNQYEADTIARWIAQSRQADTSIHLTQATEAGNKQAERWKNHYQNVSVEEQVVWQTAKVLDERELFYRMVNIEHFANHLDGIKLQVMQTLQQAEILFTAGQNGRYTDASYFPFSPEALKERTDAIYWNKLLYPYQRLTEIPDRENVIFGQKLTALGSMIDGAWTHKIGGTLRYYRCSDGMMLAIYADEMGRGDVEKNHITLILRALKSMDIHLPHIRDPEFRQQDELPDIYAFSLHQLGMSLFPDTFYEELLGYNLGIEMLGLGEMRMHEIQKLRHYGFDTIYEEAHLTIDNFSAGHARQSVDLIIAYLDEIRTLLTEEELQQRWLRIWLGYASFAYFIETDLVKQYQSAGENYSELLI